MCFFFHPFFPSPPQSSPSGGLLVGSIVLIMLRPDFGTDLLLHTIPKMCSSTHVAVVDSFAHLYGIPVYTHHNLLGLLIMNIG